MKFREASTAFGCKVCQIFRQIGLVNYIRFLRNEIYMAQLLPLLPSAIKIITNLDQTAKQGTFLPIFNPLCWGTGIQGEYVVPLYSNPTPTLFFCCLIIMIIVTDGWSGSSWVVYISFLENLAQFSKTIYLYIQQTLHAKFNFHFSFSFEYLYYIG